MATPAFNEIHFGLAGESVEVSGGTVSNAIIFNKENYKVKTAIIRGVIFTNDVVFEDVHLGVGIKFDNCRFQKSLIFRNTKAEGFERSFNADSYSLYFSKCQIRRIQFPAVNEFERGIYFLKETSINSLDFNDLIISLGSIRFDAVSIINTLRISNCHLLDKAGQITFSKSSVKTSVRLSGIVAKGGLSFLQSSFDNDVFAYGGELSSFVFNDGVFKEDFKSEGVTVTDQLSVIGANFEKSVQIGLAGQDFQASCKKIFIMNTKVGRQLEINGGTETINEVSLSVNKSLEGNYLINGCKISDVNINGDNKNGNFRFSFCEFGNVHFSNFINTGSIAFSSCKAIEGDSLFEIESSSLGKCELFNMLMSSFSKVRIADSIVSEMVTAGVDWFDDKNLEVADNGRMHRNRREVYRQLKQVCDRQGDRIQALEFQAQELIAFRKEMKEAKGWLNKDRWILRLSVTNDFGLNWIKPLIWIVLLSVVVFYPLMVASASPNLRLVPAASIDEVRQTFTELKNHRQILPQLFNPARLTFRLFPENYQFGFWTHFWDGCQRIVLAFFIVQIVAAFRKYVRN